MAQVVSDILKSAVIVSADCPLCDAVRIMNSENRDRVYITDEIGRVSGVACDFVLLKALVRGESHSLAVGQLAAPLQESLMPTQPLDEAAVFFRMGYRTQLPVLENGQFLGIVERTSLLAALVQEGFLVDSVDEPHTVRCESTPVVSALTGLLNQQSLKIG